MIRMTMACACVLMMASMGCKSGDDDDDTGALPMAGSTAPMAGSTAAGSMAMAGSGAAGMGAAGMSSTPANMPDATCISMANHMNMACENCGCTPNAMNGCLTELMECQGAADAM